MQTRLTWRIDLVCSAPAEIIMVMVGDGSSEVIMVSLLEMVIGMSIWVMLVSLGTRRTKDQLVWFWGRFPELVTIVAMRGTLKKIVIYSGTIKGMVRATAQVVVSAAECIGSTAEVIPRAAELIGSAAGV